MNNKIKIIISLALISIMGLSGCQALGGESSTRLTASGIISAKEVEVAPQIGGQVVSVSVQEGDQVKEGAELFRLDDSLLRAQRDQADAAVKLAQESLNTAQIQAEMALTSARLQDRQSRINSWSQTQPDDFDLPVWYFNKEEKINSAKAEMDAASALLAKENDNLKNVLGADASQEFLKAEKHLAETQTAFTVAQDVRSQADRAHDKTELYNYADDLYSAAKSELSTAQSDYDRLLTSQQAKDVLEARARVRVAQERYDRALDVYNSLLTGDQSLQVKAAQAGVSQAQAALNQAQASLALIDVQLAKTIVTSPLDGTVLTKNLEKGEILPQASIALTIGQLDVVDLTVYIPETEYGKIKLNDQVSISVDSFPGKVFNGEVAYISDQAEFTPKNVQTVDGRRTTVYAVKITVPNPDHELKPGMPADVSFNEK